MTPEQRLVEVLESTAYVIRQCRFCPTLIYFARSNVGSTIPYTAEGVNHYTNCPKYRKEPDPRQDALFPHDGAAALEPTR